jgi:hypothetical protein
MMSSIFFFQVPPALHFLLKTGRLLLISVILIEGLYLELSQSLTGFAEYFI